MASQAAWIWPGSTPCTAAASCTVAVEAFGDALSGLVTSLVIGPRWQFSLAEIVETAIAETNAKVRATRTHRLQPASLRSLQVGQIG